MNTQAQARADEVVKALDRATKDLSMALFDQDIARCIRSRHEGTVQYAGLRLHNDIYEITGGNQA